MASYDIIIIGGGVAGLTAAYELSGHNKKILLVEKEAELGGMVSSYRINNFHIEKYYHHFFAQDAQILDLIKKLEIDDRVVWRQAPSGYYFNNEIFNLNTPSEILSCRFLSLVDKLRLGLMLARPKKTNNLADLDGMTAKEWIVLNIGNRVYENFFKPLLISKFGSDADISAAWLCARVRKRSNKGFKGERLGYLRGGLKVFFDSLSEKISRKATILTNTPVDKIVTGDGKVKGIFAGNNYYSSNVIISTSGAKTLLGLSEFPYPLKIKLQALEEQCLVCCVFGLKHSIMKPYWLNIKSAALPFGILIEHNNFVNFEEYQNTKIVYAITYCEDETVNIFKMPDEEIFNIYSSALQKYFGLRPQDVLWWRVSRTTEAGLVYKTGTLKLIPGTNSGISGLYLSGMMRSYPDRGINESILSARECADIILKGCKHYQK